MNTTSNRIYNIVIGVLLLYGFGVNYAIVNTIDPNFITSTYEYIAFIVIYFISCFCGMYLVNNYNSYIGFIGYNLIVISFGFIVNLCVYPYNSTIVENAVILTGATTALMIIAGTMFPKFFNSIISSLTCALIACIISECVGIFVFSQHFIFMDWIVAIIFCGYIGYDWGKANSDDKTINNAIKNSAKLYMDIINLFVRILSIIGNKK